ncbi:MAG: ELM1/GtrOC1 family putative glycosyltransferase [Candidatus Omnitrophica bacterium]|nr:ELM1/GtrOC1 family putative glycosyltransferase [Candidatus Omnitrophota bacterium]
MANAIKVIVLNDGNRGNFNQAIGIAERLPGAEIEQIAVPPPSFLCRAILILSANLSGVMPLFKIRFILRRFARIIPPFFSSGPTVIISAGSKLAPINILLSRCLSTKSVHVLYPDFIRLKLFNLLVTLEPDLWRHPWMAGAQNLIFIKGAPNRILPSCFQPSPHRGEEKVRGIINIAVLIGGDDKNYRISEGWAEELSRRLIEISEKLPAKIYLTTSRRTNRTTEDIFRKWLGGEPARFNLILYGQDFANPVSEFLAVADLVITTEDSINMVSESASSGKPTVVLKVERKNKKFLVFDRAFENLAAENYIRLWSLEDIIPSNVNEAICNPKRKVLAETEKVAAKVMELLGQNFCHSRMF